MENRYCPVKAGVSAPSDHPDWTDSDWRVFGQLMDLAAAEFCDDGEYVEDAVRRAADLEGEVSTRTLILAWQACQSRIGRLRDAPIDNGLRSGRAMQRIAHDRDDHVEGLAQNARHFDEVLSKRSKRMDVEKETRAIIASLLLSSQRARDIGNDRIRDWLRA